MSQTFISQRLTSVNLKSILTCVTHNPSFDTFHDFAHVICKMKSHSLTECRCKEAINIHLAQQYMLYPDPKKRARAFPGPLTRK